MRRPASGRRGAGRAPKPILGRDLRRHALGVVWSWGRVSSGWRRDARYLGPVGEPHAVGSLGSARPAKAGGGTHPARLRGRGRFKERGPPLGPGAGSPWTRPRRQPNPGSSHAPGPRGRLGARDAGGGLLFEPGAGVAARAEVGIRTYVRGWIGTSSRRSPASASGHGGRGARVALVLWGAGLLRGRLLHASVGSAQGEGGAGRAGGRRLGAGPRSHPGHPRPWALTSLTLPRKGWEQGRRSPRLS